MERPNAQRGGPRRFAARLDFAESAAAPAQRQRSGANVATRTCAFAGARTGRAAPHCSARRGMAPGLPRSRHRRRTALSRSPVSGGTTRATFSLQMSELPKLFPARASHPASSGMSGMLSRTQPRKFRRAFSAAPCRNEMIAYTYSVVLGTIPRVLRRLIFVFALFFAANAFGYALENVSWTRDRTVVMQLSLNMARSSERRFHFLQSSRAQCAEYLESISGSSPIRCEHKFSGAASRRRRRDVCLFFQQRFWR